MELQIVNQSAFLSSSTISMLISEIGDFSRKEETRMKIIRKANKRITLCMNCSPASAMQH